MPFLPKLSPLQSRVAASLTASIIVLALYFAFSIPNFAYAADITSTRGEDHNHERLLDRPFLEVDIEDLELRESGYEAEFIGYDRGIIGRAPTAEDPTALINNRMDLTNVEQGQTVSYSFLNASVFGELSPNTTGFPSPIGSRGLKVELVNEEEVIDGGDGGDGGAEDDNKVYVQDLRLRLRQSTYADYRTVWITVNTCVQPQAIINTTTDPPPQLQLYVSLSANNTNPGPGKDSAGQQMITLEEGAGMIVVNATGDVYIGLYGENTTAYKDVWSAQVAASIDAPYHYFNNGTDPNLYLVDSDSSSALLITGNLSNEPASSTIYQEWMDSAAPFVMFAINQDDNTLNGLQNSYCALQQHAQIGPTTTVGTANNVQAGITTLGNNQPKQQFYIESLSSGSSYHGFLAMDGNSTDSGNGIVGGGGQVWPMMNFTTLSDGNCAVIFNLSFCNQTAYAVPGNPTNFPNFTALAAFYDNYTQSQYEYFQKVLQQIPCETTSSAQYSLTRNCDDCAAAYKEWLCSVSIPRCTDFSSNLPWLQERAMGQPFPNNTMLPQDLVTLANNSVFLNSSRNPNIDTFVVPGPYKEVLPCIDLCHNIVQSCSSAMSLACPRPGRIAYSQSYGEMPSPNIPEQVGQITCNYPGAAYDQLSSATGLSSPRILAFVALAVMMVFI